MSFRNSKTQLGTSRSTALTVMGGALLLGCAGWLIGGCNGAGDEHAQLVGIAATANRAIDLAPGEVSSTVALVSITQSVPSAQRGSASLSLDPDNMVISAGSATTRTQQPATGSLKIGFRVADGATSSACADGTPAAEFTMQVQNGRVTSVDPPAVTVGGDIVNVLLGGSFGLCTQMEASFAGSVNVRELTIRFNTTRANNDNVSGNGNDNGSDDNSNDNGADDNANDNGGDDNANGNGDDNGNSNANDDGSTDGLCSDGSLRLETELGVGRSEAEYRLLPGGCERFRLRVRDLSAGSYAVVVAGDAVGSVSVGADGEGELEFDTEDGNFPADFPAVMVGDAVTVGNVLAGVLGLDCSLDDISTCNSNSNSNANDNGTDDNSNGNGTDDNSNGNADDNSNVNGDDNSNANGNDNANGSDLCADGSLRLSIELDGEGSEAEYRLLPGGCERFRLRVEEVGAGSYPVSVAGEIVGSVSVDEDGRGELEFDTEDGDFPADFPIVEIGDSVSVAGFLSGALVLDCSLDDVSVCNSNSNSNSSGNTNANGN